MLLFVPTVTVDWGAYNLLLGPDLDAAACRLQDLMGLLEGSFQPGDASEVESIVRELEGADVLLPLKEDTVSG